MRIKTYFVAINGEEIAGNLSREYAVRLAKREYDKGNTTVGIGRVKRCLKTGKIVYSLRPLHFYVD